MGAVYQAEDTKRNTICAIKEMSLSMVPPNERLQAVQNFKGEAALLAHLDHPNLPAVMGLFTEGPRHFLVMEYVDGMTLEDLLERNGGPFPERRVLGWARQLCDVLEYLHSRNPPIIFRDMKPGNIMLSRDGRIKLIDFGIARFFQPSSSKDTQLLGTPGYAPPEQYGKAQTDVRSDMYSLAMTLFQLLTNTLSEKGFGLKNVRAVNASISASVARALEKATALEADERFQDVSMFRQALLGMGTFLFEQGDQATTPEELAELCARYPVEAENYLLDGEIESWLGEIGAQKLARTAKQIRSTTSEPQVAVEKFLQAVMGPGARIRSSSQSAIHRAPTSRPAGPRSTQGGRSQSGSAGAGKGSPAVVITPRVMDFGEVYPGVSAPTSFTISGERGAFVRGSVFPVESWIMVDPNSFDGMSTRITVRVNSIRLLGSTHYTGSILVTPEGGDDIVVKVEVDVLGFSTSTITSITPRSRVGGGRGGQTAGSSLEDDEDEQDTLVAGGMGNTMVAPQPLPAMPVSKGTIPGGGAINRASTPKKTGNADTTGTTGASKTFGSAKDSEYKEKYGPPDVGWDVVLMHSSLRQMTWLKRGFIFSAAFLLASLCSTLLSLLPDMALWPNPAFIGVLLLMIPMATLGALLVDWGKLWRGFDILDRTSTGLSVVLVALGLVESAWQSFLHGQVPPLQLMTMLLVAAIGASVGTHSTVSQLILKGVMWAMVRLRWPTIVTVVLLGGSLGFGLAIGFSFSLLTLLGLLVGMLVAAALVLRVDMLIQRSSGSQIRP